MAAFCHPILPIPTTAGTGSEVGRAGVITVHETGTKTIIFHPKLMPELAVLEPELTTGLPSHVTAATGIDALTHCVEAYFAPGFHPMADGIALEGIDLVLKNLSLCTKDGSSIEARGKMLMAASMGATAFQKGLGMNHAIAHPLSSECGLHHGLANALLLPHTFEFLEKSNLNKDQKSRVERVRYIFQENKIELGSDMKSTVESYIVSLGIQMGLKNHGVDESDFKILSEKAFLDVARQTNMIPVSQEQLLEVIESAY